MVMLHSDRVFCCLSTETCLSFSHLFLCCFYRHCVFSHNLNCPFTHRPGSGPGFRLLHPITGPQDTRAVRIQQPELVKLVLLHRRRRLWPRRALGTGLRAPGSGLRAPGFRYRAPGTGLRAPGTGHRAPGAGLRAPSTGLLAPRRPRSTRSSC